MSTTISGSSSPQSTHVGGLLAEAISQAEMDGEMAQEQMATGRSIDSATDMFREADTQQYDCISQPDEDMELHDSQVDRWAAAQADQSMQDYQQHGQQQVYVHKPTPQYVNTPSEDQAAVLRAANTLHELSYSEDTEFVTQHPRKRRTASPQPGTSSGPPPSKRAAQGWTKPRRLDIPAAAGAPPRQGDGTPVNTADPRQVAAPNRRIKLHANILRTEADGPADIPLQGRHNTHYDNASTSSQGAHGRVQSPIAFRRPNPLQAQHRLRVIHNMSPDSSRPVSVMSDHTMRSNSVASVASHRSHRSVAPDIRQANNVPEGPLPIYGPVNKEDPFAEIELPATQPLDVERENAPGQVKRFLDAIYSHPLTKEQLKDMYTKYPRPANLEVLHKTRLNPDMEKYLIKNDHDKLVKRDDPVRSIQWVMQFAARPLVEVLTALVNGDNPTPKEITGKLVDALKMTAKASWKLNDIRRSSVSAAIRGVGADIVKECAAPGFQYLLGSNIQEQIVTRNKEAEIMQGVIAPAGKAHYANKSSAQRGNWNGGKTRSRHNKPGNQNKSRPRGQDRSNGDKWRQGGQQKQQQSNYNSNKQQHRPNGGQHQQKSGKTRPNAGGHNNNQNRQ